MSRRILNQRQDGFQARRWASCEVVSYRTLKALNALAQMKRGGVKESMLVIEFDRDRAQSIDLFDTIAASSIHLGYGKGEAHIYCIYLEPGAEIGVHRAGFGQMFLVVEGSAWAAGEDGQRKSLSKGQGVYFEKGEEHSKGSYEGASVIMVQVEDLRAGGREVIE